MCIKKTLKAKEQEREDIRTARAEFAVLQSAIPAEKFVCIDESSAKTNMIRLYGRAKHGKRCYDHALQGHWKTMTMLSSIRSNGETECFVYEGATTRLIFETYIEKCLCPVLHPGDIVIADNLAAHKSPRVRKLIESKKAKIIFLPAYSQT